MIANGCCGGQPGTLRVPCTSDLALQSMPHSMPAIPAMLRCTYILMMSMVLLTSGTPSMFAKCGPPKDVELELRAAWECLQRCEASYTARLDAAEAAVRETTRCAQVRPLFRILV